MKVPVLIGILILLVSTAALAESIMIVNEASPVSEISSSDAAKIFLGKKKNWENGDKIIPATLGQGAVHEDFLKTVVKKTPAQFSTYWKKIVFTGRGQAPKMFTSEKDLAAFVAETPGATGYIDKATPHPGAKEVILK